MEVLVGHKLLASEPEVAAVIQPDVIEPEFPQRILASLVVCDKRLGDRRDGAFTEIKLRDRTGYLNFSANLQLRHKPSPS
jgi:hypothetical protein